jgi:hypothetical protein
LEQENDQMAQRHHKNPLGDRSGCASVAAGPIGTASVILNMFFLLRVVTASTLAGSRWDTDGKNGCASASVSGGGGFPKESPGCNG